MADIDPAEIATDLMLWRARSLTNREIRNAIGDCAGSADLTADEFEALVQKIGDLIDTAEITIDTGAA